MPSLLEKVNHQEAQITAKEDKKILSQLSKIPEKKDHAVNKITHRSQQKDKQISAKVNEDVYRQFTEINKNQGLSNNSALNMIINKYVREYKVLIDS